MNLQDFVPEGGGSLPLSAPITREPVATFTQTRTVHPDEIWHPLGGGFEQGHGMPHLAAPVGGPVVQQAGAAQGESGDAGDALDLQAMSRTIRSALRPGV